MSDNNKIFSITDNNYQLDDTKTPMWYVFTADSPDKDADGNTTQYMIIIGPSTEDVEAVREFVANEVEDGKAFEYRGGFDHDPTNEEKNQFIPGGFQVVED